MLHSQFDKEDFLQERRYLRQIDSIHLSTNLEAIPYKNIFVKGIGSHDFNNESLHTWNNRGMDPSVILIKEKWNQ